MLGYQKALVRVTAIVALGCSIIAPAIASSTTVTVYTPWGMNGLSGVRVMSTVTGKCWIHSLSSDRADAWRCMAGNEIHDPCFAGPLNVAAVACVQGPFDRNVVLLRLTQDVERANRQPSLNGPPWGLRLANGATCGYATGATGVVAGMRLNYACSTKGWVIGEPDRSSSTWRVFYVPSLSSPTARRIDVAEAVF